MKTRPHHQRRADVGISLKFSALLCSILLATAPDALANLRIEVVTAYNLIVDSNVTSPSTKAPRAAYLGIKLWNDGAVPLTNVYAFIGDYTNSTPGIYPSRAQSPLKGPLPGDKFALTHVGGSAGQLDAIRYFSVIQPGTYVAVYWLVTYPNLDLNNVPTWGTSVKPDDDLWLTWDVWATASAAGVPVQARETRRVTMRNEISAMANKILPNTASQVPDEYKALVGAFAPNWETDYQDGSPGTTITA